MDSLIFSSVENIPGVNARAAFTVNSAAVFREDCDIMPTTFGNIKYMPWGADNQMPYDIIDLIERDETLATCQIFNAEICYGSGLVYDTSQVESRESCDESNVIRHSSLNTRQEVEDFQLDNDLASYFLGVCQDFKYFGFAVSVIILNAEGTKVVRLLRKEACYCRFAVADRSGRIPQILYANWRKHIPAENEVEVIELLDPSCPWRDLQDRLAKRSKCRKFAVLTRVPTPDSTYYPIPHYGSLFRGKWYNIKQLIGLAKEAKLKNSAPIKYQIEISNKYWESIFRAEGITDRSKQQERIVSEKQRILDFLTGAENSGKAWFSTFYVTPDGKEQHDVVIHKIDDSKEGGDWESDIQEAVNMICFTMRVHSNLVGSVPGKAQTNNSGSDKRELYTIAQALQKPYHDLLFTVHRIIIRLNGWQGVKPVCPFIQLTTLDEHADALRLLVVAEALNRAVPSLDLVLTPNGFGVVNTNTVAAASKQRVDRLIGSLRELRDGAIEQTLSLLPGEEDWVETPQAHYFATTLFPNIDLCSLCGHNSGRWEKYVELRSRAVGIELALAEDYFSPELMSELRLLNLLGSLSAEQLRVVLAIRSQIVDVLQDKAINGNRMRDVVNFIRYRPGVFRLWHTSATAKLFSPPKFENKKHSSGYFF